MTTAVLVLAILGDVFGAIGAGLGLLFGSALVGLSQGAAGQGAAAGAGLAVVAVVVGIAGTALCGRRPRVAAVLLVGAGTLGVLGTFAFALGALVYVIAGVMALFVTSPASVTDGRVASSPATAAPRSPSAATRSRVPRRPLAIGLALALLALAVFAAVGLAQPPEHRPVQAMLAALRSGDEIALAGILAPGQRVSLSKDAETVLSNALGRSEISFLGADWLRSLGPVTGTTLAFENVTLTTTSKDADSAIVHARGLFVPSNDNPLIRALLAGFRRPFDADIAVSAVAGQWYVSGLRARAPTPTPTEGTSQLPVVTRHLALGTYAGPGSATIATQGWRLVLKDITVRVDESVLIAFDLTVGPVDGPWAGRESRIELRDGQVLSVMASGSVFYDGGRGGGAVVPVALAFPPGLAGKQPYVIRVCGFGFCWPELAGPPLGER
jgi:hypothetical protein